MKIPARGDEQILSSRVDFVSEHIVQAVLRKIVRSAEIQRTDRASAPGDEIFDVVHVVGGCGNVIEAVTARLYC